MYETIMGTVNHRCCQRLQNPYTPRKTGLPCSFAPDDSPTRPPATPPSRLFDAQLLDQTGQVCALEAEAFSRLGLVTAGAGQRAPDDLTLIVVELLVERTPLLLGSTRREVQRLQGKVLRTQHAPRFQDDGPLNRILQFPHVPLPGISGQHLHRLRRDLHDALLRFAAGFLEEELDELGDLLRPLPQWWYVD